MIKHPDGCQQYYIQRVTSKLYLHKIDLFIICIANTLISRMTGCTFQYPQRQYNIEKNQFSPGQPQCSVQLDSTQLDLVSA